MQNVKNFEGFGWDPKMTQRGRKSAQLSIVPSIDIQRPEPPEELTAEQAEVWRTTCNALRADWFKPETWPLLAQFCRHVSYARLVAKAIEAADPKADIGHFNRLLVMHEREGGAMISVATKLRLTKQSSSYSRAVKHDPGAGRPKPWEIGS